MITILSSSLAFTLQEVNVSKLYIQYVSPPSTPLISVLFLSVVASCQNEKVIYLLKKKKKKEGDGGDKSAARGVLIYGFHTRKTNCTQAPDHFKRPSCDL